jgi:uncharacterized protein YktB (UPF0637 family)
MLYAFDYTQEQFQKVAQARPLPISKTNELELSRQTTKNDDHSEEECQIVEVEKVFKNLWLFLLK